MVEQIANKDIYSNKYDKEIIALHSKGLSNRGIAKIINIPRGPIETRMKHLGLLSNSLPPRKLKMVGDDMYECSKCGGIFSKDRFSKQRCGSKNEYYLSYCKTCKHRQSYIYRFSSTERRVRDIVGKVSRRARDNNIPINITQEYMYDLLKKQNSRCFYTDVEFENKPYQGLSDTSYSIDKVIPERGYIIGNVVWCSNRINMIKNNVTIDEMKKWMPDWYNRVITCDFLNIE